MRTLFTFFVALSTLTLASCGGGGGGSGDSGGNSTPDNDACAVFGLQSRIISGTACSGNSPVLRLQIQEGEQVFGCTGTLISPNKVLTASHCVLDDTFTTPVNPSNISVSLGTGSLARGSRIIASPDVRNDLRNIALEAQSRGDDPTSENFDLLPYIEDLGLSDIAVVVLNKNLSLPTAAIRVNALPSEGTILSIFGYGAIDPNVLVASPVLYSGEMSVDSTGPKNVFATFGSNGSDTCSGDSGGPALAQEADGSYSIVATTLGGSIKCVPGDTAIFTATAGAGIAAFLQSAAPDAQFK